MTNALATRSLYGHGYSTAPLQPRRDRVRAIYRKAVFALDARRTPGASAAGNTIQDLSSNALRTANGTTGNAKIVQDGAGGKALQLHGGTLTTPCQTPDSAALDITGDIDLRVEYTLDASGAIRNLICKESSTVARSYRLQVTASNYPILMISGNGSESPTASVAVIPHAVGTRGWLRATWRASDGRVQFFTSTDGSTWTQLGTDQTLSPTGGSINVSTSTLQVGTRTASADQFLGKIHRAQVYNGIDATLVADFDPTRDASYSSLSWTSATTGETWTVTPGGSDNSDVLYLPAPSTLGVTRYVYSPSTAGNGLTVPDSADWTPTTTLDARVWVSLDDWTPSSETALFGQYETTGNQRAWMLSVWTTGTLFLRTCPDGITAVTASSVAPVAATDGGWLGLRAVWDATTPSVTFYTRTDSAIDSDTGWTTLGTVVTGATVAASVFNSTSTLSIGPQGAGNAVVPNGTAFRIGRAIVVKDSTEVFDWSAEDTVTATHSAFTASTGQTVTVNRSTSGRKTVVVEAAKWLLGSDDYLEIPDNALLDLDAATDFTVLAVVRQHATPTNNGRYVDKRNNSTDGLGWTVRSSGTTLAGEATVDSGAADATRTTSTYTAGGVRLLGFVANRTAATLAGVLDGSLTATTSLASVGSAANTFPMRVGAAADVIGAYQDFELYAVYIWREALSASELAAIAADWGAA